MVIRKPYAFLIKYFKLIHLVLAILIGIVIYVNFKVINFFQEYIANDYVITVASKMGTSYVPIYIYFILFLLLVIIIAIIVLLNHKNKPLKMYFIMAIYYVLLFFIFIAFSAVISSFSNQLLDATAALLLRDIIVLVLFPNIYFTVICLIRAIGFDLKKFDFVSDMKEMNLVSEDNEEVEINLSFDDESAKRKVRKTFREITYYFFENKLIILVILAIVAIFVIYNILSHRKTNYDLSYSINTKFTYNSLGITVGDSVITNMSYDGTKLDSYYLVTMIKIENNTGVVKSLDLNKFKLKVGNKTYTTSSADYKYFIDISSEKYHNAINNKAVLNSILVFPIEKNSIGGNYKLKLYNGSITTSDATYDKNIYVKLDPEIINSTSETIKYSTGTPAKFDKTYLKNTTLTINSCSLMDKYKYTYSVCKNNKCTNYDDLLTVTSSNNQLLVCNIVYNQDEDSWYSKNYTTVSSFIDNFVKIYDVSTNKALARVVNKTPEDATDFIAFEVPNEYEELTDIQLHATIRNYNYVMLLIG